MNIRIISYLLSLIGIHYRVDAMREKFKVEGFKRSRGVEQKEQPLL